MKMQGFLTILILLLHRREAIVLERVTIYEAVYCMLVTGFCSSAILNILF